MTRDLPTTNNGDLRWLRSVLGSPSAAGATGNHDPLLRALSAKPSAEVNAILDTLIETGGSYSG